MRYLELAASCARVASNAAGDIVTTDAVTVLLSSRATLAPGIGYFTQEKTGENVSAPTGPRFAGK